MLYKNRETQSTSQGVGQEADGEGAEGGCCYCCNFPHTGISFEELFFRATKVFKYIA